MKRSINKAAISKTVYNSAYVGVLSYHVVQVKEEGAYVGHVIYKNEIVNHFIIKASNKFENLQLNLDFENINKHGVNEQNRSINNIRPGGFIVLMNSTRDTSFRFKLEKIDKKHGSAAIFDTQRLNSGDIYACTLLRPGTYEVSHNKKRAAIINVEYPTTNTKRSNLNKALRVKVLANGIEQKIIKILPMQGLVFEFQTKGSIEIRLSKEEKFRGTAYNRTKTKKKVKKEPPLAKYHWRNPKYSKSE